MPTDSRKNLSLAAGLALPLGDEIWSRYVDPPVLYTKNRLPE